MQDRSSLVCLLPSWRKEGITYICPQFFFRTFYIHNLETEKSVAMATTASRYCRTANQLLSMQAFEMQRTHKNRSPRGRRKVLPWQHLWPGVAKKLISSNPCRDMESREPIKIFIYKSKKQKMAKLVARYCPNPNQLLSMQGFGMQRTHINANKSNKQEKVLSLPFIAEKLISSNPWRGMEFKEPIKILISSRNRKKCCQVLWKT